MNLREQIELIGRLILFIETELPRYVETVAATDLAALIADRVITTGKDKDGAKFSPYSTNPDNAKNYVGKSRNQSAERKVKALQRAGTALSYKGFRELNNLQTDFKRYEFTGEMWKKFGVVRSTLTALNFHIVIGGTTPEAQDKIDNNSDYENQSIIEASTGEVLVVEKTSFEWLEDQSKRILAV